MTLDLYSSIFKTMSPSAKSSRKKQSCSFLATITLYSSFQYFLLKSHRNTEKFYKAFQQQKNHKGPKKDKQQPAQHHII